MFSNKYRFLKFLVLLLLLLPFFLNAAPTKAQDVSSVYLSASADAYMYSENIYGNYGTNQMISVVHNTSPYTWGESVIKFDLSSIPAGSTVDSADMRLYMTACDNTQGTITVKRMISNWTESTVNWAVHQDMHPTSAGSYQMVNPLCSPNNWYDFYITDIAKAWINDRATNYGVILTVPDSGIFSRGFNSKDSTGIKPQLVVNYYPPVSAPAGQADPSTGTQGSTPAGSSSSTTGNTVSTSSNGSATSAGGTTGSTSTSGTTVSGSTVISEGQAESSSATNTGAVNTTKSFFQNLWNDPLLRIALIIGTLFSIAFVVVLIIMIIKYFRNRRKIISNKPKEEVNPIKENEK